MKKRKENLRSFWKSSEMDKLTVAIHQPNYLPWMGFFYKLAKADIFVFLDEVQYPRGSSFANRNRIKTSNGVNYLTIPVSIPSGRKGKITYNEVAFANSKWKTKNLKMIRFNYTKTPYFSEIFPLYQSILEQDLSFTDLNIALIKGFADYLAIDTKTVKLSEILPVFGKKTQLIIDICKVLDAEIYLSGTGGGKDYNDEKLLNDNNIVLKYSDFDHPSYPQLWGEFKSHLSIIDLLFNCGQASKDFI